MDLKEYGDYPDLSGVRRVLVVIFKNIGDVVLSTPVFSVLKKELPDVTIDAAVNGGTEAMLMGNPAINKIHVLDRNALKGNPLQKLSRELGFIRDIRSMNYDMTIVLSTGDRGKKLGLFSGAKIRVGVAPRKSQPHALLGKPLLTFPVRLAHAGRHYVERNLDLLRKVGIFPDMEMRATRFFEGEEAKAKAEKLLADNGISKGARYILLHPTSRWMFKCWPHEKVAELIDAINRDLNMKVILTSGPDDAELIYVGHVLDSLNSDVINLSGKLSLRELGALIRKAAVFFGVDSAPMHIAAAVGTPAVALFGPTIDVDWGPWGKGHKVITSSHSCRPCSLDGCGGSKRSECLEVIETEEVFLAIKDVLKK